MDISHLSVYQDLILSASILVFYVIKVIISPAKFEIELLVKYALPLLISILRKSSKTHPNLKKEVDSIRKEVEIIRSKMQKNKPLG